MITTRRAPVQQERLRRTFAALVVGVLLCASADAACAVSAPSCSVYGTVGLIRVSSAQTQTRGVLSVALAGHYYESYDLSDALGVEGPGSYTALHLNASYGLSNWLEAAVDLPFRRASWSGDGYDVSGEVLDAPRFAAKLGTPLGDSGLSLALEGRFDVPFSQELAVSAPGGPTYFVTGGKSADWQVLLLSTYDLTDRFPLRAHVNIGWAFNADERGRRFYPDYYPSSGSEGSDSNDALLLRGAIEFPGHTVDLFTEFVSDLSRKDAVIAPKENPITVTPGVRLHVGGLSATVGFTVGLSGNDASTQEFDPHDSFPDWEVTASVGYGWPVTAADSDGDGIPDYRDGCRNVPEDVDGYQDDDGCPDPDNDGDGIPDYLDGDPWLPEDIDGFEDSDGIPDLDNDGDGIIDARDMCPDEPEDIDGFEDQDGCPDP